MADTFPHFRPNSNVPCTLYTKSGPVPRQGGPSFADMGLQRSCRFALVLSSPTWIVSTKCSSTSPVPNPPTSKNNWSPEQVIATFAPSTETVDTVRNWLYEEGIDTSRVLILPKVWIQGNATVEEAERLLQTQYNVYSHVRGKRHVGKLPLNRVEVEP